MEKQKLQHILATYIISALVKPRNKEGNGLNPTTVGHTIVSVASSSVASGKWLVLRPVLNNQHDYKTNCFINL